VARYTYYTCRILSLACCVAIGATTCAGAATAPEASQPGVGSRLMARLERLLSAKCLTPDAGRTLTELVAAGRLQPVLPSDFTLVRGDIRADQIELEIRDQAQHSYGIALALAGSRGGTPDGQGRNFLFYLTPSPESPNERAAQALLAVAALFDEAIPDAAMQSCSGKDAPRGERRYPRTLSLAGAVVDVLIVLAATVFGLRVVRRRGELT
jgi:hypothetical protein